MRGPFAFLRSKPRTIDRLPYLLAGLGLFAVKFVVDWCVARFGFGRDWSLTSYLVWPNSETVGAMVPGEPDRTFLLTMLFVSLPFLCIGVYLTLLRMDAVGFPTYLLLFFFIPQINLLFIWLLCVLPTRPPAVVAERLRPVRAAERRWWRSGLAALAISVAIAVAGVVLGTVVMGNYGFSVFMGGPFALGLVSAVAYGVDEPKPLRSVLGFSVSVLACVFAAMMLLALEGAICLVMAFPIIAPLTLLGSLVGYVIQSRPWLAPNGGRAALALLIAVPALMAAEAATAPEPSLRAVTTAVVVNAPAEVVWTNVITFPPLAEPNDWMFRAGVAYPMRAEIHGTGAGAVRHCVFSTGPFVEPIEVWDAPWRLAFRVTEQPDPMREWSPYAIHPPHLHGYLLSQRGEFRLEALPGGRTRLSGTTWYFNRMWPAPYWGLWSDHIIGRIHGRVLEHIRVLAEGSDGAKQVQG